MDYIYSPWNSPGRILEWAFPFSRGFSQPRDQTQVSRIASGFFTSWATREAQEYWSGWSKYWSGWSIPSPVDLPDPGIKLGSPALQEQNTRSRSNSENLYREPTCRTAVCAFLQMHPRYPEPDTRLSCSLWKLMQLPVLPPPQPKWVLWSPLCLKSWQESSSIWLVEPGPRVWALAAREAGKMSMCLPCGCGPPSLTKSHEVGKSPDKKVSSHVGG